MVPVTVKPQDGTNREKKEEMNRKGAFKVMAHLNFASKVANVAFGFHNMPVSCILSDICTVTHPLIFISIGYTQLVKSCVVFGNIGFNFLWFSEEKVPLFS